MKQVRLNTLANTKKSYCRLLREYLRGEIDTEHARAAAYLMNGLLQYWRLESDLRIEERLEKIEQALEAGK